MKRKIWIAAVIATLCALVAAGSAVAYFSHATESVANVITTGEARIELLEEELWAEPQVLNPNETIGKSPTVYNAGSVEVFVRIRMSLDSTTATMLRDKTLVLEGINYTAWDGFPTEYTLVDLTNGLEIVATLRQSLGAGKVSPPLFTGVTLGDRYVEGSLGTINIDLVAEAVQTMSGKTATECFNILSKSQ